MGLGAPSSTAPTELRHAGAQSDWQVFCVKLQNTHNAVHVVETGAFWHVRFE